MTDQQISVIEHSRSIMPAMAIEQARERYQALHDFIAAQMVEGTDYGVIPGTEQTNKKVLLKPGAEKLSTLFALRPRFVDVQAVEDWTGKDHGEPFFYYRVKACLWHGDEMICDADGSCNSMEKKYRYRQAKRVCPTCGQAAIIKGKDEFGGGWLCWKKQGGCGMKFSDGDTTIESQEVGQVPNPDIADQVNTILKMAQKRALIAAILIAANASDYFTQDIEDEEDLKSSAQAVTSKPSAPKNEPVNGDVHLPEKSTVDSYLNFAKQKNLFVEANDILKENKGDVDKSLSALLKGFVPPDEWPK
jgi:hypothetical protein